MKTFPIENLKFIKLIKPFNIDKDSIDKLCYDIINENKNSFTDNNNDENSIIYNKEIDI